MTNSNINKRAFVTLSSEDPESLQGKLFRKYENEKFGDISAARMLSTQE